MRSHSASLVLVLAFVVLAAQDPVSTPKPDSSSRVPGSTAGGEANSKGMVVIDVVEPSRVTLDNLSLGNLDPGDVKFMPLFPGKHVVTGVSVKSGAIAKVVVDLKPQMQEAVLLEFSESAKPIQKNPKDGLEYAFIPEGAFAMGCSAADDECSADELPPRQVEMTSGFWISRTEVTRGAYARFCTAAGRPCPEASADTDSRLPQDNVSWPQADAYCRWIGGRLPTEAEWEYAARGGQQDLRYPAGNAINHEDANYSGRRVIGSAPFAAVVGSFPANSFGLYDMAGNLSEWCAEWYGPYTSESLPNPSGPATGTLRVVRGGSWNNLPVRLRVSARSAAEPSTESPVIGFRCVRSAAE